MGSYRKKYEITDFIRGGTFLVDDDPYKIIKISIESYWNIIFYYFMILKSAFYRFIYSQNFPTEITLAAFDL